MSSIIESIFISGTITSLCDAVMLLASNHTQRARWLPDIWKLFPWTLNAKQKRTSQKALLDTIQKLRTRSALDEDFFCELAEVLHCPVALIAPHTSLISHTPYDASSLATVPKETLREVNTFVLREQLSPVKSALCRTLVEYHAGVAVSLWRPPERAWNAWLIFGENLRKKFYTWEDYQLLIELVAVIRERYIKLMATPALKLQERSAMIANLQRRVSQFESQRIEADGLLTTPNSIQASIPASPNSENILQAHIDRYHRRILDIALKQSRGKAEVASQYLGMSNINLIRLMQRLGVDREAYLEKNR